jgi:exodeoxyribonuclease VII large subunit
MEEQKSIPETILKTYNYYKQGNSIKQIEELRNLKETTIYGHIEKLISKGLIDVNEIVNQEKKEKILNIVMNKEFGGLKEIKEQLDDSITYEEIRCVVSSLKIQEDCNPNKFAHESQKPDRVSHPELFEKLKHWCNKIAEEKGIPSFFILHLDTLKEIVNKKPINKEELEEISGMGKKKIESYGDAILKIINPEKKEFLTIDEEKIELEADIGFPKKDILTVKELTRYIKNLLESDNNLSNLFVRGEISNLRKQSSGHIYFSLKDEETQIKCVFFRRANENLDFELEDGMKIIVRGGIEVYQPRGEYSLLIEEVHPDGLGALHLAFTQLKKKLEKEGLFSERHKKQIPRFPETIALITSPSGAVLQDILKVMRKRYPLVKLVLLPTIVQGKKSAPQIIESINLANQIPNIDLIILGRGGGSLEDLWSFNEELVARAIYSSEVPIISAVGHETDFTIADFVSDKRAPTPSAAAEIAVPDMEEIYKQIEYLKRRGSKSIYHKLKLYKSYLEQIRSKFIFKKPLEIVHRNYRQLDQITTDLKNSISFIIQNKREELRIAESEIVALSPKTMLKSYKAELKQIEKSPFFKKPKRFLFDYHKEINQKAYELQVNIKKIIDSKKKEIEIIESKIIALNPKAILKRGYSIVMNKNKILINSSSVKKGDEINVILHRGKINAKVKETN